jgi:hypothetical protein
MYLSTGVDGETPVPVTGTIWVPAGDAPPEGFPIVAWGPGSNPHGMGEFGDGCVFSVRPIHPDTDHQDHFAQLLADGFVVSTTDYTGHGTQYPFVSVSETDTHALVDAARAARDLLGPAASARVIIAGFSTGGVAAAQSLLHLSPPAEDLDVRGVVSIEGFGDFTEIEPAQADEVGVHGDLRVVYLWTRAYPELRPEDVLTAEGLRLLDELHENGCVWFSQFDDVRRLDASIPEWRTVPAWDARIRAQTVMAAPVPTFYVVAEDNSRRDIIRAGAERLCETADHVAFQVYAGTDHYSVISAAYDDWAPWMKDRVSGDEPFDGCTF